MHDIFLFSNVHGSRLGEDSCSLFPPPQCLLVARALVHKATSRGVQLLGQPGRAATVGTTRQRRAAGDTGLRLVAVQPDIVMMLTDAACVLGSAAAARHQLVLLVRQAELSSSAVAERAAAPSLPCGAHACSARSGESIPPLSLSPVSSCSPTAQGSGDRSGRCRQSPRGDRRNRGGVRSGGRERNSSSSACLRHLVGEDSGLAFHPAPVAEGWLLRRGFLLLAGAGLPGCDTASGVFVACLCATGRPLLSRRCAAERTTPPAAIPSSAPRRLGRCDQSPRGLRGTAVSSEARGSCQHHPPALVSEHVSRTPH